MAAKLAVQDEPEVEVEQGSIHPDFETEKNPKIEKQARRYRKLMLARKSAGEEETAAHEELLETMVAEGVDHYEFRGLVVHVNNNKKCKVKMKGDDDAE